MSRYCRQFVYGDFLQVKEFHQGFFIGRKPLQGLFEVLHLRLPEQNFLLVVGEFVVPVIYLYRAGAPAAGMRNRRVVGYPVEPGGETALPAEPVQMGERFQEYVGCQFFRIQPVARNACQQGEDTVAIPFHEFTEGFRVAFRCPLYRIEFFVLLHFSVLTPRVQKGYMWQR